MRWVRRLLCSSLGMEFDTNGCHEIPGFLPLRSWWEDGVAREHGTVVLLTPHLLPVPCKEFPEKVSLGLRASYHSSKPPGAAPCRMLFISVWEQTVPPRGGLKSSPGADLCPARHPCEPSGVQSVQVDRVWTCIKVVFNTSRLVWLWGRLGRPTRVCC